MRRLVKKLLCGVGFALLCNQMGAQSLDQAKKLYNEGEYAEAKPAFEKLVKQSPGNASYNLWYGVCCYETGDLKAAEKYLSSAVKRRVIEAYRYMGELYYQTYRFAEAVEMYDDYIDLQTKKKRDTEAAEARQEVIEGAQRMMENRLTLGEALGSGQKHELARQNLRKLCTRISRIAGDGAETQRKNRRKHRTEYFPGKIVFTG